MSPITLMLGINIVALIFMLIGFLKGREGLKYTLVRFIFFLLAIGLALISMDMVADKLASVKILSGKSMGDFLINIVNSNSFLSGMYNSSDKFKQVIDQLPKVFLQSISYTLSLIFYMIICKIAYIILKELVLKHITWFDTGKKPTDSKDKKSNKDVSFRSKIFGGLMGMVYGFVVLMFLVMPLSGIVNTISKVIGTIGVSAEETTEEPSAFGKTFDTIRLYINAYHNTPLGAASGVAGMDIEFTRKISSVTIDGKRISVIDKVENMKSIYGDIVYFAEFKEDYEDLSSINDLDLARAKSLIKYLLDNELFNSLFDEVSSYTIDYVLDQNMVTDPEVRAFIIEIYNQMQLAGGPKNFVEDEIYNILDVGQIIIDSKVFTEVNNYSIASKIDDTEENHEERKQKLQDAIKGMLEKVLSEREEDKSYLSSAVAKFNDSRVSNITANFVLNKFLVEIEKTVIDRLPAENLQPGIFGRVTLSEDFNFEQIGEMFDRAARIYSELSTIDLSSQTAIKEILTKKTEDNQPLICDIVVKLGEIAKFAIAIDSVNKTVDGEQTILDKICYYFPKANMFDYVNLEYLQEEGIVDYEVNLINSVITRFMDSNEYQLMIEDDFDQTKLASHIVSFLAKDDNTNYTVTTLLSTKLFRNLESQGAVKVGNMFADIVKTTIKTDYVISEINTEDMFTESEKEKISTVIEKGIKYYDLIDDSESMLYAFAESDLTILADVLDYMRDVKLFKDYDTQGYYRDLMLAIEDAYSMYLNFDVATEDSFSWTTTMEVYGTTLNSFLSHNVDDTTTGSVIKMIDVIVGNTEMTIEEAIEQLTVVELLDYSTRLTGCQIIEPVISIMLNAYSAKLGD